MIDGNLDTTNVLLAVLAAVSILEGVVLLAALAFGYRLYRQAMQTVRDIEARQLAPLASRVQALAASVEAILADVKGVTGRVSRGTERVDTAIAASIDRVDRTAGRVRASMTSRIARVAGFMQGVRSAVENLWNGRHRPHAPTAI